MGALSLEGHRKGWIGVWENHERHESRPSVSLADDTPRRDKAEEGMAEDTGVHEDEHVDRGESRLCYVVHEQEGEEQTCLGVGVGGYVDAA